MMENSARNTIVKLLLTAVAFTVMATSSFASSVPQDKKTVTVEGIVMGADQELLIGAMVYVKGIATTTASSTMTDSKGHYSLSVPSDAVIVASLLGFKEQEQAVGGRSRIDFLLESESTLLDDAVVIGYGTQSKLTLTGSVAQTSGRELIKNS